MFDIVSKVRTPDENKALMKLKGAFSAPSSYGTVVLLSDDAVTEQAREELGSKLRAYSTTRWCALLVAAGSVAEIAVHSHSAGFKVERLTELKRFHKFIDTKIDRLMSHMGTAIGGDNLWTMGKLIGSHLHLIHDHNNTELADEVIAGAHDLAADYFARQLAHKTTPLVVNGEPLDFNDPETKIEAEKLTIEDLDDTMKHFSSWLVRLKENDWLKYGVEVW